VDGVIKICDFGVSKVVKPGEKMSEQCGTPAYIAPEILLDKGYEGFAVDIWSAGVVLYAMLYGTVPFKANNMSELQKMIIKAKFTLQDGISKESKDLLRQLLEKDPALRITIPNILAHPWMRDAKDTVELFTNAEKNYMKYEFSCQEQGGLPEMDLKNGDPFLEQMLDTCQNSILKNAETKSIILAPFNSTRSNLEELERCFTLPSEIKEMI
jgi:serine/threonine protein kinase